MINERTHDPINGRFEPQISEETLMLAVGRCNGMGTGDIANDMGFEISGIRKALKALEEKGLIKHTTISKRYAVWWINQPA